MLSAMMKFNVSQYPEYQDLTLAEAGVDSLGLVEAAFTIEERFDISIPFNANEQSQAARMTVGQLLDQVVDLVVQKRASLQQLASA